MKKIMTIVIVVLVAVMMGTSAFAKPNISGGNGDIMGQGKFPSDPHKIFRLVRYIPASGGPDSGTLAAESIVVWDTTSDDGVTVTTSTTSYDSAVAGILVLEGITPEISTNGWSAVSSIGRRSWTWLQTYGKAQVRVQSDSSEVDAGDAMGCGDDAGEATDFLPSVTDATANGNAGFFYDDATAGADDIDCFVMCD